MNSFPPLGFFSNTAKRRRLSAGLQSEKSDCTSLISKSKRCVAAKAFDKKEHAFSAKKRHYFPKGLE